MIKVDRVLIVDDEQDVRFIITSILRKKGIDVESASDVQQCLEVAEQFQPDAIILDIDLPDGSGLDALPELKTMLPETVVIMNSALDTEENRSRSKALGSDAFLSKPLVKSRLFDALNIN